jgi:hypothetical protein
MLMVGRLRLAVFVAGGVGMTGKDKVRVWGWLFLLSLTVLLAVVVARIALAVIL